MMIPTRVAGLLLTSLLLLPLTATAVRPNWTHSAAVQAVDERSAQVVIGRLLAHSAILPAATQIDALLAIEHDSGLSWPQRERILQGFAHALREEAPTAEGALVLTWLSHYEPRVLVAHEESAAHGVPLFNVAASAAGSLNAWQLELAYDRAAAALRSGKDAVILEWAKHGISSVALIGLEQALSQASSDAVRRLSTALQLLVAKQPETASLAMIIAQRGGSLEPLRLALTSDGPGSVQLVGRIRELPAAVASDLWLDAVEAGSPAVASAALVELARAGLGDQVARHLGDPQLGAGAALALARHGALDALADTLLSAGTDSTAQRHAALGLKLNGSPAARAALSEFARRSPGSTAVEVSKWLR